MFLKINLCITSVGVRLVNCSIKNIRELERSKVINIDGGIRQLKVQYLQKSKKYKTLNHKAKINFLNGKNIFLKLFKLNDLGIVLDYNSEYKSPKDETRTNGAFIIFYITSEKMFLQLNRYTLTLSYKRFAIQKSLNLRHYIYRSKYA